MQRSFVSGSDCSRAQRFREVGRCGCSCWQTMRHRLVAAVAVINGTGIEPRTRTFKIHIRQMTRVQQRKYRSIPNVNLLAFQLHIERRRKRSTTARRFGLVAHVRDA